jgi:spermidine dehydrogenase
MDKAIPRRDFLNGVALGTAGLLSWSSPLRALGLPEADPEKAAGYYPPALTGLRGSHEGSYAAAHALKDDHLFQGFGAPEDTGESYDLVVVGGGISGLSSAHFFRKSAGPNARILILDNHDDFGGHAKRNEFKVGGRTLLAFGGTWSIDSPAPYSATAKGLVAELGIDVAGFSKAVDRSVYGSLGLGPAVFFDKETFGTDRLVPRPRVGDDGGAAETDPEAWRRFLEASPLGDAARRDIGRLLTENADYLPGLTSDQKKARLARMSYADYLTRVVRCDPSVLPFFQTLPQGLYGVGIDAVPAQDAWGLGFPGFDGLKLDPKPGPGMNRDAKRSEEGGRAYFFHFPDGNASITRLLVRRLVPGAIPGTSADDVVTARAGYARLDVAGAPVRIRLNSTVVRVAHRGGAAAARDVDVTYVRGGKLKGVRAGRVVLACWNNVIPYICTELPEAQKQALHYGTKVPIVYTHVALKRWTSFAKLKVSSIDAPGSYHPRVDLDMPVSIGAYHCTRSPEEPIVVNLTRTPCSPGLPARDQHRAGRVELLATSFETFEREIRDQLARSLGAGGFDPAAEIAAITVNRWPHGYAYQYNSLFDPFWLEGGEPPCVTGRRPFGRIAIANADADAYAYTDCAIDQAHRAVQEVLAVKG